jgi:hypothetical protein
MITIVEYSQPTDLVLLLMQYVHMVPWNLEESLMIYDDYCDITVQIEDTYLDAECGGFISLVTLEQFENIINLNPIGESGEPIVQELMQNMDCNAVYVLPNFVGKIEGTCGSYLNDEGHDWNKPYYIRFPKGTVIESFENTKKRLKT